MKAYDIAKQYQVLADITDINYETGEILDSDTYSELLKEIDDSRDDKLTNIEYIKREIEAENELIANEIKRLQGRKKANDTKVERLESLQLMLVGEDKIKTPLYTFSTRKSESVDIQDESLLEKRFLTIVETIKPIKEAIKKAIKNGEVVQGATIKQKVSISVR